MPWQNWTRPRHPENRTDEKAAWHGRICGCPRVAHGWLHAKSMGCGKIRKVLLRLSSSPVRVVARSLRLRQCDVYQTQNKRAGIARPFSMQSLHTFDQAANALRRRKAARPPSAPTSRKPAAGTGTEAGNVVDENDTLAAPLCAVKVSKPAVSSNPACEMMP